MKPIFFTALTLSAIVLCANQVQAHPGRTDAQGCHTNRQTGEYHCHNSGTNTPSNSGTNTPSNPQQTNVSAQVVSVGDGDTLRAKMQGQTVTLRLGCIDAPEMAQSPFGVQAKNRLQQILPAGQTVQVRSIDRDQYGRTVAELFLGGRSVNLQMVAQGQAAVYPQYLSGCSATQNQYLQAENQAKQQRLGFWSQSNPVMPWVFRSQ
jgi:micrococcal nuclease